MLKAVWVASPRRSGSRRQGGLGRVAKVVWVTSVQCGLVKTEIAGTAGRLVVQDIFAMIL